MQQAQPDDSYWCRKAKEYYDTIRSIELAKMDVQTLSVEFAETVREKDQRIAELESYRDSQDRIADLQTEENAEQAATIEQWKRAHRAKCRETLTAEAEVERLRDENKAQKLELAGPPRQRLEFYREQAATIERVKAAIDRLDEATLDCGCEMFISDALEEPDAQRGE